MRNRMIATTRRVASYVRRRAFGLFTWVSLHMLIVTSSPGKSGLRSRIRRSPAAPIRDIWKQVYRLSISGCGLRVIARIP